MGLGEDEAVAALLLGVQHVEVQILIIEGYRHLHDRELTAEVAHADAVDKVQKVAADVDALVLKLRDGL